MKKWGLLLTVSLFLFLFPLVALSQYGPMGIGNVDGMATSAGPQPRLLLWLDGSSSATQTDNGLVSTWNDLSGNGHNFTSTGNNRPKFLSGGGPSSTSCVSFDSTGAPGNSDRMVCNNFELTGNAYTVYFVVKTNDDQYGIFSYATSSHPHEMLIYNDNGIHQQMLDTYDQAKTTIGDLSDGTWNYGGILWNNSNNYLWEYNQDDQSEATNNNFANGITISNNGKAVIGDIQNSVNGGYASPDAFHGQIAEIIIYEGFLKKGPTRLMRTYLWTKYGEDFDNSNPGWDKFHRFASGSDGKYYEPIGIGIDAGNSTGGSNNEARSKGLVLRVDDGDWNGSGKYLCAAVANSVTNSIVSTDLSSEPSVLSRWSRVWEIAGAYGGGQQYEIAFDFGEGISGDIPQNADNFVLLYRTNPNSENFSIFNENNIAEKSIVDDEVVFRIKNDKIIAANKFYTIGTTDPSSTLDGSPLRTWYAYQTGNWNDPFTWTLDGSAAPAYVNPGGLIPSDGDNIYIGSGRTVSVNVNGLNQGAFKIYGTLDVGTASAPSFSSITGSGLIRCAGNGTAGNFPTGNATAFADPVNGGTAEFYGSGGFTQTTNLVVNKLKINFDNPNNAMTLAANLTHNGLFEVIKGTFIVNDNSEADRTLTSNARVLIEGDGQIKVSSTSTYTNKHKWVFYSDLINNGGQVKFTNRTNANYSNYSTDETKDFITAYFESGSKNQELRANGDSYFSRIVIDKGVDATYILSINSTNATYFKLLGPCSNSMGNSDYYSEGNNKNSFAPINGTVEIKDNIFIPLQTDKNNGNYNLNKTAQIWINGGEATKGRLGGTGDAQAIVNYGIIKVSKGTLNAHCKSGITTRGNGILQVDGGELYANQLRTSNQGVENIGGIIINGGKIYVNGNHAEGVEGSYYTVSLTYPGNLFRMTGGELHVTGPTGRGLIFINSDPQNTSVSGGTVFADVSDNNDKYKISSRAAFWNLTITRSSTSTGSNNKHVKIEGGSSGNGSEEAGIADQDLIVRNDLKIIGSNNPTLEMGGSEAADLYLYGDLETGNGCVYNHNNNTTHFVGSSNSSLTFGGNTTFPFFNVEVNKDFDSRNVNIQDAGPGTAMNILGSLNLERGIFINRGRHVLVKGNVTNRTQFGDETSSGYLRMDGNSGRQKIISDGGVFYKLALDNSSGVALENDGITVKNSLKLDQGSFFIGDNKLRMETTDSNPIQSSNGTDKFIVCSGNASAGGIEILNHEAGQHLFYPFGVSTGSGQKYTPADIYVNSGWSDDGFVRITPVDTLLSTADISGTADYLNYYWRVSSSDYDDQPKVTHRFKYDEGDIEGTESNFESGRVLAELPFSRSIDNAPASAHVITNSNLIYYNGTDQSNGTTGTGTKLVNADYSAGAADRFTGSPQVFFSRSSAVPADWETPGNWNKLSDCTGCSDAYDYHSTTKTASVTDFPEAGDIAVIGFNVNSGGKPHVYKAPTGGIQAAQIQFTPLQDSGGNRQPRYNGSGSGNLGILRPTLQISSTSDITKVRQISGEGELMLTGDIDLGVTDIGGFLAEDSSVVVIKNADNSAIAIKSFPANIPNLFIAIGGPKFTSDLRIRGNLEVAGTSTLYLSEDLKGNIEIDGDLILNQYQASSSTARVLFNKRGTLKTIEVHGDVKLLGSKANIGVNTLAGAPVDPVPWTPDQVGPLLWLDASDESTVTTSGSYVTGWQNKAGGSFNAAQTVAADQPTYQTGLNSKKTIRFDGSNDFLSIPNNTVLNMDENQDFEIFTVIKQTNASSYRAIFAKGETGYDDFLLYVADHQYKLYLDHGALDMRAGGNLGSDANIGWARRQGNSGKLYNSVGGTASDNGVSGASNTGNTNDVIIGAAADGSQRNYAGDIAEIILVKHALTSEERDRMEAYLAYKWGLDVPGNPYNGDEPHIGGTGDQPAQLIVDGDIIQKFTSPSTMDNGLVLYKITPPNLPYTPGDTAFVNLIVTGSGTNEYKNLNNSLTPKLWKLTVDKGTSTASSFTFNTNVNIDGPANVPEKPVNIQNGLLKFNNASIVDTLSSGSGDFVIPNSGGLELNDGKLFIKGVETGMILSGSLKITGGSFDIGNTEGDNNYIEYAASGAPKLNITGGTLTVGSQIRRGLSSLGGSLDYRQSGGDVIIGRYSAPAANRGMLEVLNTGSRFDHTGGTLTFVRGVNLGTTPSLLLDPDNSTVNGSSEIFIGNSNTPSEAAIQNFGIKTSVPLNAFTINTTKNPVVHLITNDLELNGDLEIQSGATLNCEDRNLLLHKDVSNNGVLSSASGTVTLDHSGTGHVDGSGVFDLFNLVRTGGNSGNTEVSVDLLVNNDFTSDDGTISFGTEKKLTVKGDVIADGKIQFDDLSEGLIFSGSVEQHLDRSSTGGTTEISTLTVDNSHGVTMANGAGYTFVIDEKLRLSKGVFNLQGNLLELGLNSDIEEINSFGEDNMISTGGAFTNFGVLKNVPAGSDEDMFIPLGIDKYMPMSLDFSVPGGNSGNSNSSYLIKIINSTNSTASIYPDSVLAMYFSIDATNVGDGLKMNMLFYYDESYVRPNPNIDDLYSAIWVHQDNTTISKLGTSLVDENANVITFPKDGDYAGYPEALDGDYFAGAESALPDNIPIYETVKDGDVDDGDNEYTPTVDGGGKPSGAWVKVMDTDILTFNVDNVNFYRTDIAPGATVVIDATSFHRLGKVSGTGTIKLVGTGNLPSGNYNSFFNCGGGKLIYESRIGDSFEVLSNVPPIEKVDIIGQTNSDITIADNDVTICTDLTIDGPRVKAANSAKLTVDGNLSIDDGDLDFRQGNALIKGNLETTNSSSGGSVHAGNTGKTIIQGNLILGGESFGLGTIYRETHVENDVTKTSGTISQGTGGAKLVFDGIDPQTITGDFTGTSKIPFIEMNNGTRLTLNGNVDVSDTLKLTNGNIFTSDGNFLKLTDDGTDVDPEGGQANSFVDGPMQWYLLNSTSERTFPVGKKDRFRPLSLDNRSATRTWEVEYYDTIARVEPVIDDLMLPNPTDVPATETVSIQEYWRVDHNGGSAKAKVRLSWGNNSAVSPVPGDYNNLKVLAYNTSSNVWDAYGGEDFQSANGSEGDFISDELVPFSERFLTLGSSTELNPLPVTWLYFKGETDGKNHTLTWATASEKDNDYFELERSVDAQNWKSIAKITGAGHSTTTRAYKYVDHNAPFGRVYYRVKQVDFDARQDYAPNIVSLERAFEAETSKFDFLLYPNPTTNQPVRFRMSTISDAVARVLISDLSGKRIREDYVQIDGQGTSAPMVCNFEPGIYLVTVIVNANIRSKPLVITR